MTHRLRSGGGSPHPYDWLGQGYANLRRPDPRVECAILHAVGNADSVLNVGAGAGSYEPTDRFVVAVEPSTTMIRQRRGGSAPVVRAFASELPFPDRSFDASLAILTIHHWPDWRAGVRELARVARRRVVIFTCIPQKATFWIATDYFPEIAADAQMSLPAIDQIEKELGELTVIPIPVPHDCTDGFLGAYWRRPEAYLNHEVRRAISVFAKVNNLDEGLARLRTDLESGEWKARHASLLRQESLDIGYRIMIAHREKQGR